MARNFALSKAEQQDIDVKSAFTAGFWVGGGLATFGSAAIVIGTLFYLGAFH